MSQNVAKKLKNWYSQLVQVGKDIRDLRLLVIVLFVAFFVVIGAAQFVLGIHGSEDTMSNIHFRIPVPTAVTEKLKVHRKSFDVLSPEDAEAHGWYSWYCETPWQSEPSDLKIKHLLVSVNGIDVHKNPKRWTGTFKVPYSGEWIIEDAISGQQHRKYEVTFEIVRDAQDGDDLDTATTESNGVARKYCSFSVAIMHNRVSFAHKYIVVVPSMVKAFF